MLIFIKFDNDKELQKRIVKSSKFIILTIFCLFLRIGGSINIYAQQDNFVDITITSNNDALIFIDGKVKGASPWSGKISVGKHNIRVEKENYFSRTYEIVAVKGQDLKIDLMLSPKTGTLEIVTDPPQAMISINGRMYGFSPRTISELPFGEYNVTVEKPEYSRVVRRVIIDDVKPVVLELNLYSGKEVTIITNPSGAKVYNGDEVLGVTPLTVWLKFGEHLLKFEKEQLSLVEKVAVYQSGTKKYEYNLKLSSDPFENQMVFVKGGVFRMGDSFGDGNKEEKPVHQVLLNDFFISKYEVTQAQWEAIMGDNPSHFAGCNDCPVERVSWVEVQEFLAKVNELTGKSYRLPTEAEWEYAARGGQESRGFRYAGKNNINFVSWYSGNSQNKTHPVGQMEPNELGIYDMSGNVWEWTYDWFDYYTDSPTPAVNPIGPEQGDFRIVRGGSWYGYIGGSRVACRGSDDPANKRSYIGFRVVHPVVDPR